jgi:hypothetical protein
MAPGFGSVPVVALLFFAVGTIVVLIGLAGSVWLFARRKQAGCRLDRVLALWWSGVVGGFYLCIGLWLTVEGFWFDYAGPPLMIVAFVFIGLFLFLPALLCEFWVPKFGAKLMIFVAIIGGLSLSSIQIPDLFSESVEYKWWMKTLGFGVLLPYWIAAFAILLTATKSRKFTLRDLIWAVTLVAIALGTCGAVIRSASQYQPIFAPDPIARSFERLRDTFDQHGTPTISCRLRRDFSWQRTAIFNVSASPPTGIPSRPQKARQT